MSNDNPPPLPGSDASGAEHLDLRGRVRLEELHVQNLGVIEDLSLVLPSGAIAVTGETGAGKTMVVGAIQLLMGGRADPDMVRVGADDAVVQGRFVGDGGEEIVVKRVVPAQGRSRAYLDGSLATASSLSARIGPLIDVHGQHDQQSLLQPATQREALDRFGSIDTEALRDARAEVAAIRAAMEDLGGDATERARQIDLLAYQLDELNAASLDDPDEDEHLRVHEDRLSSAFDDREAAARLTELLGSDGDIAEGLSMAATAIDGSSLFDELAARLATVQEEVSDLASTARAMTESIVDDEEARSTVRSRRQLLAELRRKYGPTLHDVIGYREDLQRRLQDLQTHETRAAALEARLVTAEAELRIVEDQVLGARRAVAEPLARAVETELSKLAMPDARLEVTVEGAAGDDVRLLLAANPGLPSTPIGKGASGGELSRTMLALRLVVAGGPPIRVFDEVDAGIGGETARAVGEALASLGDGQTFVVTHLAQVAAMADTHVVIAKSTDGSDTISRVRVLNEDERVVEVSRMLSGSPDSGAAQTHAEELLRSGRAG